MRKFGKPLVCLILSISFFVMAFLWNVPSGSYEMDTGIRANKIIAVDYILFRDGTTKIPLTFFSIEEYDTLIIHRMRSKIKYYGERLSIEGTWIESEEWIRLDKPLFASIKKLEVNGQRITVYYGRNTSLMIFFVIMGVLTFCVFLVLLLGVVLSKSQYGRRTI